MVTKRTKIKTVSHTEARRPQRRELQIKENFSDSSVPLANEVSECEKKFLTFMSFAIFVVRLHLVIQNS